MKQLYVYVVAAVVAMPLTQAKGQDYEVKSFRYTAQCTTKSTGGDGARHSCSSNWSTHSLPSSFVYDKDSLRTSYSSRNGSQNKCEYRWKDYVNVYRNIEQPQTLEIRARARGPKGHFSGRGWSHCVYTGEYFEK